MPSKRHQPRPTKSAMETVQDKLDKTSKELEDLLAQEKLRPSGTTSKPRNTASHPKTQEDIYSSLFPSTSTSQALVPAPSTKLKDLGGFDFDFGSGLGGSSKSYKDQIEQYKRAQLSKAEKEIKELKYRLRRDHHARSQELVIQYEQQNALALQQEMQIREARIMRMMEEWRRGSGAAAGGGMVGLHSAQGALAPTPGNVIVLTTPTPLGYKVKATLGAVSGSHVTIMPDEELSDDHLREMPMLARREAHAQIMEDARSLGANCIVSFAWHTRAINVDTQEMLCTGTALLVEPEKDANQQSHQCKECGHTHGKNKGKGKGGGDGGGGKQKKRPPDCEHDEDEECDCVWPDQQKGKNKGGGGGGGNSGRKLGSMETIVKVLMEMKAEEDRETKINAQKRELMKVLDKHFEEQARKQNSNSQAFTWLDKLIQEQEKKNGKGGSANNTSKGGNNGKGKTTTFSISTSAAPVAAGWDDEVVKPDYSGWDM